MLPRSGKPGFGRAGILTISGWRAEWSFPAAPRTCFRFPNSGRRYEALLGYPNTHQLYSYPPHGLFLAVPFGLLSYPAAFILWDTLTLAFFVWAARPFYSDRIPWWVAIFCPASLICLSFGQYGLLTSGLFLLAFRGSGLAAAALTFKPQIGFLVAPRALMNRRQLTVTVCATAAIVALSALVFGIDSWLSWFTEILPHQLSRVSSTEHGLLGKQVTPALAYGLWGQLTFAGAAIYLLTKRFNVFTAATATFLISPYGFHYDMPAASLGFACLLLSKNAALWQRYFAAFAFCVPGLGLPFVSAPILLATLYAQVKSDGDSSAIVTLFPTPATTTEAGSGTRLASLLRAGRGRRRFP